MKIYSVLTIHHDDDYKNTSDSYNVKAFKSYQERLKWLCSNWFEYNLGEWMKDQCCNDNKVKQIQNDNLLDVKLTDDNEIENIKIKPEKYSYETLDSLLNKYGCGEYVNLKWTYEIYNFEL